MSRPTRSAPDSRPPPRLKLRLGSFSSVSLGSLSCGLGSEGMFLGGELWLERRRHGPIGEKRAALEPPVPAGPTVARASVNEGVDVRVDDRLPRIYGDDRSQGEERAKRNRCLAPLAGALAREHDDADEHPGQQRDQNRGRDG